jgi:PKD repeat protein
MARPQLIHRFGTLLGIALLATACTTHKQETPALSGPSELSTAINIAVSPDVLTQDGASQSLVTITARDNNGQPLRNLPLRVQLGVDGTLVDFGSLSARNVVTDASGRATVTFTAPPAPAGPAPATDVQIIVTPTGSDFANATPRSATIRVVPGGTTVPPRNSVTPSFTVTPASPTLGEPAVFDASASTSTTGTIVQWLWNFGDGATASGEQVQHVFSSPGTFAVTLTVVDSIGASNSITRSVTVGQGTLPTADIIFSPAGPAIGQTVNFNGSGSTVQPGHQIVEYSWNFGDGTLGTGPLVAHAFQTAGTFNVTLKVTDDLGRTSALKQVPVTVTATGGGNPGAATANITITPSNPTATTLITFDGTGSIASSPGGSIVSYTWTFDVGQSSSGQQVQRTFPAGPHTATLTVVDSQGKTGTTTAPFTVSP